MARRRGTSVSLVKTSLAIEGLPSLSIVTSTGFCDCATLAAAVFGSCTGTPVVISGAATMKMISSTSMTSTIGVTLISDIGAVSRSSSSEPLARIEPIAMGRPPGSAARAPGGRPRRDWKARPPERAGIARLGWSRGYSAAARCWTPRSRARRLPSRPMPETKVLWIRPTSLASLL